MQTNFKFICILILSILFSGCATMPTAADKARDVWLPEGVIKVGGGVIASWKAWQDGNVYFVEEVHRVILITQYVGWGEIFEFNPKTNENSEFLLLQIPGLSDNPHVLSELRFGLYFVPF